MEKQRKDWTTILFVSAILVNPVISTTTSSTSNITTASATTATTTVATPTQPSTTAPPPTTTQSITTTTPTSTVMPVVIGGSCNETTQCKASNTNTKCNGTVCVCEDNFFELNYTCIQISFLTPTSLSLNSSETIITVAWKGPSGLPMYNITYNIDLKGGNFSENKTATTEFSQFDGLIPGTKYTISVTTVINHTIITLANVTDTKWTRPNPPSCPSDSSLYIAPNITVTWDKPLLGGVDGYIVQFNNGTPSNVKSPPVTFVDTKPGVNYTLTIQTHVNGTIYSNLTTCRVRTKSDVPGPPNNVTVINKSQTSIGIHIVSTDIPNGDIAGYRFYLYKKTYHEDQKFMFNGTVYKNVTPGNNYSISGLDSGTYYQIQVYTENDMFNSSESFNVSEVRTDEGTPGPASNVNFTRSRNNITVTWERPEYPRGDITGYRLQITGDNLCKDYIQEESKGMINRSGCVTEERVLIVTNQKMLAQEIKDLKPFTSYLVKIWAYTKVDIGGISDVIVMTESAPPYQPIISDPLPAVAGSIVVTWTSPLEKTGPTFYTVTTYDVIEKKNISNTCTGNGFDSITCTVNGLQDFWVYRFIVTAKTEGWSNSSEWSKNVTTKEGAPGQVIDAGVSLDNGGCKAILYWSTPKLIERKANISQYLIMIGSSSQYHFDQNPQPYEVTNKKFSTSEVLPFGRTVIIKIYALGQNKGAEKSLNIDTSDCYEPLTAGEIAGIAICVILLAGVLGAGAFLVYRKWDSIKPYLRFGTSDEQFETLQPMIDRNRPIVLSAIDDFLKKYHSDDNRLFIAEYDDLQKLVSDHQSMTASLEENKAKNRYFNVLPYDHSRVILAPTDDEESSDYINANYIPGYTYGKEYIACQGPLPGTTNDFWRMIWEQCVSIIVMLTKCSENNMDKCEHYWPMATNEPKCYDDLMVNVTSISNMGKYDIHIMDVCLGDEKRVVKHFHFLEWADFSAKVETETMIDFISTVRSHITPDIKGPTVTHCSAGVGRTGTFIAVDYLMQFVRDHDLSAQVDIFDWVLQMRDHRTTMVQTVSQYVFIHDTLGLIVERKRKSLQQEATNGDVAIVNLAFEPDDLYENTKLGMEQQKTEL